MDTKTFSMLTHELRTPINILINGLELASEDLQSNDIQGAQDTIATLMKASEHLLMMINQILSLGKIEYGQGNVTQFNLREYAGSIEEIFSVLSTSRKKCAIKLVDISQKDIFFNKTLLNQLIFNLLGNSFKYTNEGTISLSLTVNENILAINVTDSGKGIAKKDLPKVMDFYQQVGNSTEDEGSGIGLYMVKRILTSVCGKINIESEEGKGTSVEILIPLTSQALMENPNIFGTGKIVLVVDDDEDIVNYLEEIIQATQPTWTVLKAYSGNEAVARLDGCAVDICFTDLIMPNGDGFAILDKLKGTDTKVFGISGVGLANIRKRCGDAIGFSLIEKPFEFDDIKNLIQ